MRAPFSFNLRKLSSAFAFFGAVVALAGAGMFFYQANHFLQRQAEHEAARRLAVQLRVALQGAQDMESSQRGFLLTGKESYLMPFDAGRDAAKTAIVRFGQLATTRAETHLAERLLATLGAKERELTHTIDLSRRGQRAKAQRLVDSDEGKLLMDRYRLMIDRQLRFYGAEQERLQSLTAQKLATAKVAFAAWMASFGSLLCFALASSRLAHRRLREATSRLAREASHDALTGLPNRRYLDEELARELAGASRRGEALCALYMDLDGFSQINNTLGHGAGDLALQRVCETLRSKLRDCDFLARVGGDEFVAICPQTTAMQAATLGARLIEAVNALAPLPEAPAGLLGVSVGVAAYPECALTQTELLVAADEAMYAAKRAGKRVLRHAPTLHSLQGSHPSSPQAELASALPSPARGAPFLESSPAGAPSHVRRQNDNPV